MLVLLLETAGPSAENLEMKGVLTKVVVVVVVWVLLLLLFVAVPDVPDVPEVPALLFVSRNLEGEHTFKGYLKRSAETEQVLLLAKVKGCPL